MLGGITVTALLIASLSACSSKQQEQYKDAPKGDRNNTPALIIEMPDGFSNLATKCVGDVRYTVVFHNNSHYGSVATVVDPACKSGSN